jgi:hypothetical protein
MMHQDSRLRSGQLVALPFVALLVVAKLFVAERSVWAQDDDLNCEDFPSQAAAQREYERDRSDPNNLDADNDGQACEVFDYGASGARGAADPQYGRAEVIVKTIPGKGTLADTGGPPLILLAGAALLSTGLLLSRSVIRRAP